MTRPARSSLPDPVLLAGAVPIGVKPEVKRPYLNDHEARRPVALPWLRRCQEVAREVTVFAPGALPELVQTPEFARARLKRGTTAGPVGVERQVEALVRHQWVVLGGDVAVRVYVSMSVLSAEHFDDPGVAAQLAHLLALSLRSRNAITFRIVPDGFGLASAFTLAHSGTGDSVICPVSDSSGLLLSEPAHLTTYRAILDQLDAVAWPREKSQSHLAELVKLALSGDEDTEDVDPHPTAPPYAPPGIDQAE